jgi:hypothetical protein
MRGGLRFSWRDCGWEELVGWKRVLVVYLEMRKYLVVRCSGYFRHPLE